VSRALDVLARAFALAGGTLLVAITGMSVVSIAGRTALGRPLPGDFELVQVGSAVAVAAFLPYCQLRRGHIIVDFFTVRAGPRGRGALDAVGALLLAAVMALLAWRTAAGMLTVRAAGEVTMIVGFPVWLGYAAIVPSLALTALAGLVTALEAWSASRE
jgi:TRAP-type C4-dicarboxylate transport system permease small subunit